MYTNITLYNYNNSKICIHLIYFFPCEDLKKKFLNKYFIIY